MADDRPSASAAARIAAAELGIAAAAEDNELAAPAAARIVKAVEVLQRRRPCRLRWRIISGRHLLRREWLRLLLRWRRVLLLLLCLPPLECRQTVLLNACGHARIKRPRRLRHWWRWRHCWLRRWRRIFRAALPAAEMAAFCAYLDAGRARHIKAAKERRSRGPDEQRAGESLATACDCRSLNWLSTTLDLYSTPTPTCAPLSLPSNAYARFM